METSSPTPQNAKTNVKKRARLNTLHRPLDIAMCVLIAISPLALGGTHPLVSAVLCAVALLITGASVTMHGITGVSPRRAWPIYLLFVWCLWVLLRSTILGAWTNPAIAQQAWALWPDVTARGGIAPGRANLWVLRTLTFALCAWYGTQRFVRSKRAQRAVIAVVVGALLVAAVGVAQLLTRTHEVLWFYAPIDWSRVVPLAGPFVNPNQAGAYVGLGGIVALIGARYVQSRSERAVCLVLALPLLGYVVLVGARGAAVAAVAAILTLLVCMVLEGIPPRWRAFCLTAIPIGGITIALVLLYGGAPLGHFFDDGTLLNKVEIWHRGRAVPMHGAVFGFGPGGFQDVFSALGLNLSHVWVGDPESGVLQLLSEHGIPIALGVCALVLWLLIAIQRPRRRRRALLANGTTVIAVYVIIETITGMGLHASSYLIATGFFFGIACGRINHTQRPAFHARSMAAPAAMCVLVIIALVGAPAGIQASLNNSRVPLATILKDHPPTDPALLRRAEQLARQTPGRPALIQQVALVYSAQGKHKNAMRMADGLGFFAPHYAKADRAIINVATRAAAFDKACEDMHAYLKEFGALPREQFVQWRRRAPRDQQCFTQPTNRLKTAMAFLQSGDKDRANAIILGLASTQDASAPILLAAIDTSLRMHAPQLAEPWVRTLLTHEDLTENAYGTLLHWATRNPGMAPLAHQIASQAARSYPDDAEFRAAYIESFLALPAETRPSDWYAKLLPVIAVGKQLAIGDSRIHRRIELDAGEAAWQAQAWDDAETVYKELVNASISANQAALVLYRLGDISRRKNDFFHARAYFKRALDKKSTFKPAQQALQQMRR